MHEKSNEGGERSASLTDADAQRVYEDPHRITIYRDGISIGFGDFVVEKVNLPKGGSFQQLSCPKLFISSNISPLILQGRNILTFLNDEKTILRGRSLYSPPFFITRLGKLKPTESRVFFENVVIVSVPPGTEMTLDLMGALVKSARALDR